MSTDFRTRLTRFYEAYNPEKLDEVDDALIRFEGREEKMFKFLVAKYGPEPPPPEEEESDNDDGTQWWVGLEGDDDDGSDFDPENYVKANSSSSSSTPSAVISTPTTTDGDGDGADSTSIASTKKEEETPETAPPTPTPPSPPPLSPDRKRFIEEQARRFLRLDETLASAPPAVRYSDIGQNHHHHHHYSNRYHRRYIAEAEAIQSTHQSHAGSTHWHGLLHCYGGRLDALVAAISALLVDAYIVYEIQQDQGPPTTKKSSPSPLINIQNNRVRAYDTTTHATPTTLMTMAASMRPTTADHLRQYWAERLIEQLISAASNPSPSSFTATATTTPYPSSTSPSSASYLDRFFALLCAQLVLVVQKVFEEEEERQRRRRSCTPPPGNKVTFHTRAEKEAARAAAAATRLRVRLDADADADADANDHQKQKQNKQQQVLFTKQVKAILKETLLKPVLISSVAVEEERRRMLALRRSSSSVTSSSGAAQPQPPSRHQFNQLHRPPRPELSLPKNYDRDRKLYPHQAKSNNQKQSHHNNKPQSFLLDDDDDEAFQDTWREYFDQLLDVNDLLLYNNNIDSNNNNTIPPVVDGNSNSNSNNIGSRNRSSSGINNQKQQPPNKPRQDPVDGDKKKQKQNAKGGSGGGFFSNLFSCGGNTDNTTPPPPYRKKDHDNKNNNLQQQLTQVSSGRGRGRAGSMMMGPGPSGCFSGDGGRGDLTLPLPLCHSHDTTIYILQERRIAAIIECYAFFHAFYLSPPPSPSPPSPSPSASLPTQAATAKATNASTSSSSSATLAKGGGSTLGDEDAGGADGDVAETERQRMWVEAADQQQARLIETLLSMYFNDGSRSRSAGTNSDSNSVAADSTLNKKDKKKSTSSSSSTFTSAAAAAETESLHLVSLAKADAEYISITECLLNAIPTIASWSSCGPGEQRQQKEDEEQKPPCFLQESYSCSDNNINHTEISSSFPYSYMYQRQLLSMNHHTYRDDNGTMTTMTDMKTTKRSKTKEEENGKKDDDDMNVVHSILHGVQQSQALLRGREEGINRLWDLVREQVMQTLLSRTTAQQQLFPADDDSGRGVDSKKKKMNINMRAAEKENEESERNKNEEEVVIDDELESQRQRHHQEANLRMLHSMYPKMRLLTKHVNTISKGGINEARRRKNDEGVCSELQCYNDLLCFPLPLLPVPSDGPTTVTTRERATKTATTTVPLMIISPLLTVYLDCLFPSSSSSSPPPRGPPFSLQQHQHQQQEALLGGGGSRPNDNNNNMRSLDSQMNGSQLQSAYKAFRKHQHTRRELLQSLLSSNAEIPYDTLDYPRRRREREETDETTDNKKPKYAISSSFDRSRGNNPYPEHLFSSPKDHHEHYPPAPSCGEWILYHRVWGDQLRRLRERGGQQQQQGAEREENDFSNSSIATTTHRIDDDNDNDGVGRNRDDGGGSSGSGKNDSNTNNTSCLLQHLIQHIVLKGYPLMKGRGTTTKGGCEGEKEEVMKDVQKYNKRTKKKHNKEVEAGGSGNRRKVGVVKHNGSSSSMSMLSSWEHHAEPTDENPPAHQRRWEEGRGKKMSSCWWPSSSSSSTASSTASTARRMRGDRMMGLHHPFEETEDREEEYDLSQRNRELQFPPSSRRFPSPSLVTHGYNNNDWFDAFRPPFPYNMIDREPRERSRVENSINQEEENEEKLRRRHQFRHKSSSRLKDREELVAESAAVAAITSTTSSTGTQRDSPHPEVLGMSHVSAGSRDAMDRFYGGPDATRSSDDDHRYPSLHNISTSSSSSLLRPRCIFECPPLCPSDTSSSSSSASSPLLSFNSPYAEYLKTSEPLLYHFFFPPLCQVSSTSTILRLPMSSSVAPDSVSVDDDYVDRSRDVSLSASRSGGYNTYVYTPIVYCLQMTRNVWRVDVKEEGKVSESTKEGKFSIKQKENRSASKIGQHTEQQQPKVERLLPLETVTDATFSLAGNTRTGVNSKKKGVVVSLSRFLAPPPLLPLAPTSSSSSAPTQAGSGSNVKLMKEAVPPPKKNDVGGVSSVEPTSSVFMPSTRPASVATAAGDAAITSSTTVIMHDAPTAATRTKKETKSFAHVDNMEPLTKIPFDTQLFNNLYPDDTNNERGGETKTDDNNHDHGGLGRQHETCNNGLLPSPGVPPPCTTTPLSSDYVFVTPEAVYCAVNTAATASSANNNTDDPDTALAARDDDTATATKAQSKPKPPLQIGVITLATIASLEHIYCETVDSWGVAVPAAGQRNKEIHHRHHGRAIEKRQQEGKKEHRHNTDPLLPPIYNSAKLESEEEEQKQRLLHYRHRRGGYRVLLFTSSVSLSVNDPSPDNRTKNQPLLLIEFHGQSDARDFVDVLWRLKLGHQEVTPFSSSSSSSSSWTSRTNFISEIPVINAKLLHTVGLQRGEATFSPSPIATSHSSPSSSSSSSSSVSSSSSSSVGWTVVVMAGGEQVGGQGKGEGEGGGIHLDNTTMASSSSKTIAPATATTAADMNMTRNTNIGAERRLVCGGGGGIAALSDPPVPFSFSYTSHYLNYHSGCNNTATTTTTNDFFYYFDRRHKVFLPIPNTNLDAGNGGLNTSSSSHHVHGMNLPHAPLSLVPGPSRRDDGEGHGRDGDGEGGATTTSVETLASICCRGGDRRREGAMTEITTEKERDGDGDEKGVGVGEKMSNKDQNWGTQPEDEAEKEYRRGDDTTSSFIRLLLGTLLSTPTPSSSSGVTVNDETTAKKVEKELKGDGEECDYRYQTIRDKKNANRRLIFGRYPWEQQKVDGTKKYPRHVHNDYHVGAEDVSASPDSVTDATDDDDRKKNASLQRNKHNNNKNKFFYNSFPARALPTQPPGGVRSQSRSGCCEPIELTYKEYIDEWLGRDFHRKCQQMEAAEKEKEKEKEKEIEHHEAEGEEEAPSFIVGGSRQNPNQNGNNNNNNKNNKLLRKGFGGGAPIHRAIIREYFEKYRKANDYPYHHDLDVNSVKSPEEGKEGDADYHHQYQHHRNFAGSGDPYNRAIAAKYTEGDSNNDGKYYGKYIEVGDYDREEGEGEVEQEKEDNDGAIVFGDGRSKDDGVGGQNTPAADAYAAAVGEGMAKGGGLSRTKIQKNEAEILEEVLMLGFSNNNTIHNWNVFGSWMPEDISDEDVPHVRLQPQFEEMSSTTKICNKTGSSRLDPEAGYYSGKEADDDTFGERFEGLPENLKDLVLDAPFRDVDMDGDGVISLAELIAYVDVNLTTEDDEGEEVAEMALELYNALMPPNAEEEDDDDDDDDEEEEDKSSIVALRNEERGEIVIGPTGQPVKVLPGVTDLGDEFEVMNGTDTVPNATDDQNIVILGHENDSLAADPNDPKALITMQPQCEVGDPRASECVFDVVYEQDWCWVKSVHHPKCPWLTRDENNRLTLQEEKDPVKSKFWLRVIDKMPEKSKKGITEYDWNRPRRRRANGPTATHPSGSASAAADTPENEDYDTETPESVEGLMDAIYGAFLPKPPIRETPPFTSAFRPDLLHPHPHPSSDSGSNAAPPPGDDENRNEDEKKITDDDGGGADGKTNLAKPNFDEIVNPTALASGLLNPAYDKFFAGSDGHNTGDQPFINEPRYHTDGHFVDHYSKRPPPGGGASKNNKNDTGIGGLQSGSDAISNNNTHHHAHTNQLLLISKADERSKKKEREEEEIRAAKKENSSLFQTISSFFVGEKKEPAKQPARPPSERLGVLVVPEFEEI